ncbi:MAG: NAD(P)H-dependent oxidoreductase subunit E [Candidatus Magasanikbacteria bacterium]|nr:NAD(P)H-dependent oxidoreductase subunit E [Candidatus Magasanikbacteria bacterium]
MGKKPTIVRVCQDCSCIENGAEAVVKKIEDETGLTLGEKNKQYDLDYSVCLGGCDFGPNMLVNGNFVMGAQPDKVMEQIEKAAETKPLTQQEKEANLDKFLNEEL